MDVDVAVLGQAGRDVVLVADRLPRPGGATSVRSSQLLGGKGANQAVALAQTRVRVALVAVLGQDPEGGQALEQARADCLDVGAVVRRGRTALLVDLLESGGVRRLLEDVPDEALLREVDVEATGELLAVVRVLSLQLQQPSAVLRHATGLAPRAAVVLDGVPAEAADRDALLGRARVLRADHAEAELLAGHALPRDEDVLEVARRLVLEDGLSLVVLETPTHGNAAVWRGGELVLAPVGPVVDPTGGGDTLAAGLVAGVLHATDEETTVRRAVAAAGSTVRGAGGRPALRHDAWERAEERA